MWDFDLMAAQRAIEKSMAYVLYRLMICLGAALGYLFATLAGAGTLVGFGSLSKNASSLGHYGAVAGFFLFAWLMFRLRPIWLNVVNVPQLALLVDQTKNIMLPTGKALVEYAKQRQTNRFPSTSKLFELDEAIRKTQQDMAELHPCPKLPANQPVIKAWATRITGLLSALNHQTVLAWHLHSESDNPWRTAFEALAVQERHFAHIAKNRLFATLFAWLGLVLAYPLLRAGINLLIEDIPINMSFWPEVFAGVFAWAIKAAFFDTIAEAAIMQVFFPLAEQEAGSTTSPMLTEVSSAYRQIQERAGYYLG